MYAIHVTDVGNGELTAAPQRAWVRERYGYAFKIVGVRLASLLAPKAHLASALYAENPIAQCAGVLFDLKRLDKEEQTRLLRRLMADTERVTNLTRTMLPPLQVWNGRNNRWEQFTDWGPS